MLCPTPVDAIYLNLLTIMFLSFLFALGVPAKPKASSSPKHPTARSSGFLTALLLLAARLTLSPPFSVSLYVALSRDSFLLITASLSCNSLILCCSSLFTWISFFSPELVAKSFSPSLWHVEAFDAIFSLGNRYIVLCSSKKCCVTSIKFLISIEFRITRCRSTRWNFLSKSNRCFFFSTNVSLIVILRNFSIDWSTRKTVVSWKFSSKMSFNFSASSSSRLSPSYLSTIRLTSSLLASFIMLFTISLNFFSPLLLCIIT